MPKLAQKTARFYRRLQETVTQKDLLACNISTVIQYSSGQWPHRVIVLSLSGGPAATQTPKPCRRGEASPAKPPAKPGGGTTCSPHALTILSLSSLLCSLLFTWRSSS